MKRGDEKKIRREEGGREIEGKGEKEKRKEGHAGEAKSSVMKLALLAKETDGPR